MYTHEPRSVKCADQSFLQPIVRLTLYDRLGKHFRSHRRTSYSKEGFWYSNFQDLESQSLEVSKHLKFNFSFTNTACEIHPLRRTPEGEPFSLLRTKIGCLLTSSIRIDRDLGAFWSPEFSLAEYSTSLGAIRCLSLPFTTFHCLQLWHWMCFSSV